ncbi:phosphatase PAP2 family protein [Roseivirga sp. BDSF3-8]|uniref:phosphatase PAP2 family protein n=1 Tax=Roseivirga sp. BDSF3-8 TaxID=3241598 RepID=UPI00353260B4
MRHTLLIVWLSFFSLNLQAQDKGFDLDKKKDGSLILGGAALFIGGEIAKRQVETFSQAEIDALDPASVNAFDRGATRQSGTHDDLVSTVVVLASGLAPLSVFTSEEGRRDFYPVAFMYGETVLLVNGAIGMAKGLAHRTRPYVYNPSSDEPKDIRDARYSFFSGHTANAAAVCFLTASLVQEYSQRDLWKWVAWSGAVVVPGAVGVLRYTSGMHFPTDIITGYAVGAGVGLLVPYLHRKALPEGLGKNLQFNMSSNSFLLVYRF